MNRQTDRQTDRQTHEFLRRKKMFVDSRERKPKWKMEKWRRKKKLWKMDDPSDGEKCVVR